MHFKSHFKFEFGLWTVTMKTVTGIFIRLNSYLINWETGQEINI